MIKVYIIRDKEGNVLGVYSNKEKAHSKILEFYPDPEKHSHQRDTTWVHAYEVDKDLTENDFE